MENRLESSASTALSRFPREAFCLEEAPEIRISEIRRLGASWMHVGESWRRLGASWRRLGASWSRLGASWSVLEASWSVLERLGGLLRALCRVGGHFETPWFCLFFGVFAALGGLLKRL